MEMTTVAVEGPAAREVTAMEVRVAAVAVRAAEERAMVVVVMVVVEASSHTRCMGGGRRGSW